MSLAAKVTVAALTVAVLGGGSVTLLVRKERAGTTRWRRRAWRPGLRMCRHPGLWPCPKHRRSWKNRVPNRSCRGAAS